MTGVMTNRVFLSMVAVLLIAVGAVLTGPGASPALAQEGTYYPGQFLTVTDGSIAAGGTYNVTFSGPGGYSLTIAVQAASAGKLLVAVPPYIDPDGRYNQGSAMTVSLQGGPGFDITVTEPLALPDGATTDFLVSAWNNSIALLRQSVAHLETLDASSHLDTAKAVFNAEIADLAAKAVSLQNTGAITMGSGKYQGVYTAADLEYTARLLYGQFLGLSQVAPANAWGRVVGLSAETWDGWWHQIDDQVTGWQNQTEQVKNSIRSAASVWDMADKWGGGKGGNEEKLEEKIILATPLILWINTQFSVCLDIAFQDSCDKAGQKQMDNMKDRLLDVELILTVVNAALSDLGDTLSGIAGLDSWLASMTQIKNELLAWHEESTGGGEVDLVGEWQMTYSCIYEKPGSSFGPKKYEWKCRLIFWSDGRLQSNCDMSSEFSVSGDQITMAKSSGRQTFTGSVSGGGMSGTWTETPEPCGGFCHDFVWSAIKND